MSDNAIVYSGPLIGILLCTFNGAKYLKEQLDSITNQDYKNWRLFVSDDGSMDETLKILCLFKKISNDDRVIILKGPGKGPSLNFLSLINLTYQHCDYLAFCDQDDIWYTNKLSRAVQTLEKNSTSLPAMYCSSTTYISETGIILQNSYIFKNPPSFKNALVQSIAGGNTMVFNQAAASLLSRTQNCESIVAHDWWTYILVSAFSGNIFYDPNPTLYYRQHSGSLVGENRSIKAKIIRTHKLLDGRYKSWNIKNLEAIAFFINQLPSENKKVFIHYEKIRSKFFFVRIYSFYYSGVKRQTLFGNIALFIGVILNRV